MDSVRLTVGMPIYNKEKYLEEAIDSVLTQDYDSYRIILWDDGSTDDSGAICDSYASKYPEKITVFHEQNGGGNWARYNIYKKAKSDYIYFIDADDSLTESVFFSDVIKALDDSGADMAAFPIHGFRHLPECTMTLKDVFSYILDGSLGNSVCNKVFRLSSIDIDEDIFIPHVDMVMGADLFLQLILIRSIKSAVYIDKEYYYYRTIIGSQIHSFIENGYDTIPVLRRYQKRFLEDSLNKGLIEPEYADEMRMRIEAHTLSRITGFARKVKYIKGYHSKREYLKMIYNSLDYIETRQYVNRLPLKRRLVIWSLNRQLYLLMMVAFKFF